MPMYNVLRSLKYINFSVTHSFNRNCGVDPADPSGAANSCGSCTGAHQYCNPVIGRCAPSLPCRSDGDCAHGNACSAGQCGCGVTKVACPAGYRCLDNSYCVIQT
jgi:hypothetical protein